MSNDKSNDMEGIGILLNASSIIFLESLNGIAYIIDRDHDLTGEDKGHSVNNIKMEFHISRKARDFYQFDDSLFSLSGNVILPNFHAARVFSQKINEKRDLVSFPEQAIKAGQINAHGTD